MIDLPTLRRWIEAAGCDAAPEGKATMRLRPRADAGRDLPPFYVQLTDNWVLFSMLPMQRPGELLADDLARRLLAKNRAMRLAKFAKDAQGDIVLCAELPTESLDASEVADAVRRMTEYAASFRADLLEG